jgi:hypothetical protein
MSTPQTFVKKPIAVEAMLLDHENAKDICDWMQSASNAQASFGINENGTIVIHTHEGDMTAEIGDWVLREPEPVGDRWFYPCKPSIFDASYFEKPPGAFLLSDMRDSGLLWYVNATCLHQRGFAIGVDPEANTWVLMGNGREPFCYLTDEITREAVLRWGADPAKLPPYPIPAGDLFNRFEEFLDQHRLASQPVES